MLSTAAVMCLLYYTFSSDGVEENQFSKYKSAYKFSSQQSDYEVVGTNTKENEKPELAVSKATRRSLASVNNKSNNVHKNDEKINKLFQRLAPVKKDISDAPSLAEASELTEFITNESQYNLMQDYYAIKKSEVSNSEDLDIVEQKLGFLIVKADEQMRPQNTLRVVYNGDTKSKAIFTGVLKVKLTDMKDKDSLFGDIAYQVLDTYEDIRVVHYQFDSYEEAMEAYNLVSQDEDLQQLIERINIELLEFARSSK